MQNLKAFQRDQLILQFGILIQPFEDLAQADSPPSSNDYRVAIAKVNAGDTKWRLGVREFATFANDIVFTAEFNDISHVPERFRTDLLKALVDPLQHLGGPEDFHSRFKSNVSSMTERFFTFLDHIPFGWEPTIFEANTPFTSYLRIKESMSVVNDHLHYFDRYLKADFFQLFLEAISRTVSVRLVTTADGISSVSAISELARQEFTDYRLIEVCPKDLHDRNLRVDDQIFSLGPGVDRAGMALTNFGPSDSSATARSAFDGIIAGGRVVHRS